MRSPARSAGDRAVIAAVDPGVDRERHADELVTALCAAAVRAGASGVTGATHWAEEDGRRCIALTIGAAGLSGEELLDVLERELVPPAAGAPAALLDGADHGPVLDAALRAHRDRAAGRVVVAAGLSEAPEVVTVGALLERSAIDRVVQLAAGEADPAAVVRTRRHLRPRWERGVLVLHVQPAVGGELVPFEVPDPTPCCAAHA